MKKKKIKALVLFSGGLDSILAVKLLQEQDIEVTGLTFISYFFDDKIARKSAQAIGLPLRIVDIGKEHLKIVKKPRYGYGKNMNPCLDCHLLMLRKAKEIMKKEKFDFVATGEVLGERPFSQNRQALEILEKKSTLSGYLLRPLSAKLLKPTIPEQKGWVNRKKLLAIEGRSRKIQLALAKKYKLKDFPTPAGGCCLTDPQFSQRLKELLEKWPKVKEKNDFLLLKLGRHFWVNSDKIVVGRNEKENQMIEKLKRKGDIVIKPISVPGPTILIRPKPTKPAPKPTSISPASLLLAKELMIRYAKKLHQDR